MFKVSFIFKQKHIVSRHAPRPGTARESRARSFSVVKVFSEVSSLLGLTLAKGTPERLGLGVLFASPDVPSKLLTSLNILITGKDRPREILARCMPNRFYIYLVIS
jgi:hypothetical protein